MYTTDWCRGQLYQSDVSKNNNNNNVMREAKLGEAKVKLSHYTSRCCAGFPPPSPQGVLLCFLDVESELKNSGHAFDEIRKAASRSRALPSRKTMSVSMFIYMCRIFTTNTLLVFYRCFV